MPTVTYLLNRYLTNNLRYIIPEEAWLGNKHSVIHLKVFEVVAYRHVLNQLRRKLDDKGYQMILECFHSKGGYKLYDVVNRRTLTSRDVIFY